MKCDDFLSHVSEYLDGEADAGLKVELHHHACGCDRCRQTVETLTDEATFLHSALPEIELSPRIWNNVHLAIHQQHVPWYQRLMRPSVLSTAAALSLVIVGGLWMIMKYTAAQNFNEAYRQYERQRAQTIQTANPFPIQNQFNAPIDNPFTGYLRVRYENPFKEDR